jgi:hypothetical protein
MFNYINLIFHKKYKDVKKELKDRERKKKSN